MFGRNTSSQRTPSYNLNGARFLVNLFQFVCVSLRVQKLWVFSLWHQDVVAAADPPPSLQIQVRKGIITEFLGTPSDFSINMPNGMQMTFTNSYYGVPILFESWAPKSAREFAGSFLGIVLAAFCMRALIFARSYLNSEYWGKTTGVRSP
jgi:hypothetical protein